MFWGHLLCVESVTDVEDLLPTAIFQQNVAPPHRFLIVRDYLDGMYPDSWIDSPLDQLTWSLQLPNLTSLVFCFVMLSFCHRCVDVCVIVVVVVVVVLLLLLGLSR
jgi:hypothetical protein